MDPVISDVTAILVVVIAAVMVWLTLSRRLSGLAGSAMLTSVMGLVIAGKLADHDLIGKDRFLILCTVVTFTGMAIQAWISRLPAGGDR